jgi:hypothetical protein
MKKSFVLVCLLTLTACSGLGQGGKETRVINEVRCSGFENWEACDAKAKQTCSNGYDVVKKDESVIEQKRVLFFYCK